MKNKIKIITVLLMFYSAINAQDNTGSPYSGFGYGILENQGIGGANGYGGATTGLALHNEINILNPAAYSAIHNQSFVFHAGFRSKRVDYTNSQNTATKYESGFTGINTGFKLKDFWSAGFGITPFSSVGYNVRVQDSIVLDNATYQTQTNYYGEGGLNKLYFSTAFDYKGLSLGADFSYMFGLISKRVESRLYDESFNSFMLKYNNYNLKGLYITYGMQYVYDMGNMKKLTVGLTYNNKTKLSTENIKFITNITSNSQNTISDTLIMDTTTNIASELPQKIGAGISYQSANWVLSADFSTGKWSEQVLNKESGSLENSFKIAGGVQYKPSLIPKNYMQAIKYRLGGYYTNTYINYNGNPVLAYGLTFGFGIPAKKSHTYINLGFEIGQKANVEQNLLQENYYGINLSLNMSDIWFIKRKFD